MTSLNKMNETLRAVQKSAEAILDLHTSFGSSHKHRSQSKIRLGPMLYLLFFNVSNASADFLTTPYPGQEN